MKRLIIAAFALAAAVCVADEQGERDLAALNDQIDQMLKDAPMGSHGGKLLSPELKALMDQRSGGLVYPKTNGKTLLLIDARGKADGFLDAYVAAMKPQFHLGVTSIVKEIAQDADLYEAAKASKTAQSPAVVMIVDRPGKPALSVFPEDAIGIVNAAPLADADAAKCRERLTKETWRCVALSLGGFATTAPNGKMVRSILSPVYSVGDLDAMGLSAPSPNQCAAVYESVSRLGLQASKPVVYSVACKQGWAPAPTNSIQRAIRDKILSDKERGPSNPIKIPPPGKK